MDVSSIPEPDQQQHLSTTTTIDQLNPQLQEQTQALQYPQYQVQDYYYQTQFQSYDQSYYSYYQQYPDQNQWQYGQQIQHYAYYQPDYSVAYQQPPYYHHESAPGVSAPQEVPQIADSGGTGASLQAAQQQHPQSAYPPPQTSVNVVVPPPPPGMNPAAAAAIAALEQLTQFAGTMDAAERAMAGLPAKSPGFMRVPMRHPDGRYPRRDGGPSRGGGHGNVGHHHGSASSFRGRGHGRGKARSRHFQQQGATSSYPEHSDAVQKANQSASAPENVGSNCRTVQIAWCELCRVDCTSLEILEQHKNGKRHKKNLLRIDELKTTTKLGEERRNDQEPVNDFKPEEAQQPQIAQDGEEQKSAENLPAEAASDENGMENDLQNNTEEKLEVPAEQLSDQQGRKQKKKLFDSRTRGMKRKMKGGRGVKHMKISETHRRPVEPPKPKVVAPLICDLCNVKCDTGEVLNRHFSGKKHIAKLKRFEGHQALYGPTGLQVLYPPNPIAQTYSFPQVRQPFYGHQGSFPPHGVYYSSQAHQSASVAAGLDHQFSQSSMSQQSEAALTFETNPATAV